MPTKGKKMLMEEQTLQHKYNRNKHVDGGKTMSTGEQTCQHKNNHEIEKQPYPHGNKG